MKKIIGAGVLVLLGLVGLWYLNQSNQPVESSAITATTSTATTTETVNTSTTTPAQPATKKNTATSDVYMSPSGVKLLKKPAGWVETVDLVDGALGEIVVFSSSGTDFEKPPLIIVSWEQKTDEKNSDARRNRFKAQTAVVVVSEKPVTIAGATGYLFEATLTKNGVQLQEKVYMVEKGSTYYEIIAVAEKGNTAQGALLDTIVKTLVISR